jgi:hypothetical protein
MGSREIYSCAFNAIAIETKEIAESIDHDDRAAGAISLRVLRVGTRLPDTLFAPLASAPKRM